MRRKNQSFLLFCIFIAWLSEESVSFQSIWFNTRCSRNRNNNLAKDTKISTGTFVQNNEGWTENATATVKTSSRIGNKENTKSILEESDGIHDIDANSIFSLIACTATACLFESDLLGDASGEIAGKKSSDASALINWINDKSAFALQSALNKLKVQLDDETAGLDRDEASSWIRWMKATPSPMIADLSDEFRVIANASISEHSLSLIDQSPSDFLSRMECRLLILPSGSTLNSALFEAPASVIFGKLLFGGITRYRLIGSQYSNRPPRRAGERTEIKPTAKDSIPAWLQYGGADRMYEAVDMGPAAVLEIVLMPKQGLISNFDKGERNMQVANIMWKPQKMFSFVNQPTTTRDVTMSKAGNNDEYTNGDTSSSLSGRERNDAFRSDFRSTIGGLKPQIDAIVRRVLDGRVIRPVEDDSNDGSDTTNRYVTTEQLTIASMEAQELKLLGLTPVRGLLLYGPPGCGKTALAREISRALRARAPKIVSAPELLDRWVGGSEKLVRALFADAEAELAMHNGDATKSALHVIVIDEIDAVFRKRTSTEDTGEATRSSVVNQILAKLDGVSATPNMLLIGMTNRRELLDEALLRPGRLEVQIEIPLPNQEGRREILQIHFDALRKNGRLSKPLCQAIDGIAHVEEESESKLDDQIVQSNDDIGRKRRAMKKAFGHVIYSLPTFVRPTFDLSADYATGGFSGADIAGLVRCAGSLALSRARRDGNGVGGLLITLEDVKQALKEVRE